MKTYIGTKIIEAKPMTRGDYNIFRGWQIPENENPADEGYLVKYLDGYISWSPKSVFEEAYLECDSMSFSLAIEALKKGRKVARKGWNGKGMYLFLCFPASIEPKASNVEIYSAQQSIAMRTADSSIVVGWTASQTDMLANDWVFAD